MMRRGSREQLLCHPLNISTRLYSIQPPPSSQLSPKLTHASPYTPRGSKLTAAALLRLPIFYSISKTRSSEECVFDYEFIRHIFRQRFLFSMFRGLVLSNEMEINPFTIKKVRRVSYRHSNNKFHHNSSSII